MSAQNILNQKKNKKKTPNKHSRELWANSQHLNNVLWTATTLSIFIISWGVQTSVLIKTYKNVIKFFFRRFCGLSIFKTKKKIKKKSLLPDNRSPCFIHNGTYAQSIYV